MAAGALRQSLLECFEAALAAVDARERVAEAVERDGLAGDWHVVAIGKAAGAMTLGAAEQLGERLRAAVVVSKPGHVPAAVAADPRIRVLESAHPQPDASSLAAGEAVADFVLTRAASAQLLFLVSGGASSLVERLAPGSTLDDLVALNAWALRSGCAIGEINARRRKLSTLKGGGLATLAGARRCVAYLVSDVPRDDPAVIGSGLLHAARGPGQPVPKVPYRIVASVKDACRAAAVRGKALGWQVVVAPRRYAGDATRLGQRFAKSVVASPVGTLQVWGGESTMRLPARPGYGGRNQHLALAAAQVLAGHPGHVLLAAGTDGIDGVTEDAGAVVDAATAGRGRDAGLDLKRSLNGADSGHFLEASGDLLHTGPTLTNVGDVVLGLRGRSRVE